MSVAVVEQAVKIPPSGIFADLLVPDRATGIVLFAHGSGSGRFSPRNRFVAGVLQQSGFATLMLDLLTGAEEEVDQGTAHLRFDIPFLADRLVQATDWIRRQAPFSAPPVGYFGASTGAAAALVAAVERSPVVRAVVSRGGRPDLTGDLLPHVKAPTLLIVGGRDQEVIRLNRLALSELRCEKRLDIVTGAAHLFEEPGALEQVAGLARDWFAKHLG